MFSSIGAGASILFSIPCKPTSKRTAIAIYGFAIGSTERNSKRVPIPRVAGTRTNGERLRPAQAM